MSHTKVALVSSILFIVFVGGMFFLTKSLPKPEQKDQSLIPVQPRAQLAEKPKPADPQCTPKNPYTNTTKLDVKSTKKITDKWEVANLNLLLKNENALNIVTEGSAILENYVFAPNLKFSAFVVRDLDSKSAGNVKSRAYLGSENGKWKQIYETQPNSKLSLGFSHDGKFLAVVDNQTIYFYDLGLNKLDKVFTYEPTTKDEYGLVDPVFSDNNKFLVLKNIHYEGNGYLVYDVEENHMSSLNTVFYAWGDKILGWSSNKLVSETHLNDNGSAPLNGFFYFDFANNSKRDPITPLSNTEFESSFLTKNNLYYVTSSKITSDFDVCNSLNKLEKVKIEKSTLNRYSFDTKKVSEVLSFDSTPNSRSMNARYIDPLLTYYIDGKAVELLVMNKVEEDSSESRKAYILDGVSLTELSF